MKRVAVLGATGSIGASAASVLERHADRFRVVALTGHRNADRLTELEARLRPREVVLVDAAVDAPSHWHRGREAMLAVASREDVDIVINAVVGAAGLEATLLALASGKRLALANKESLVAGGPLVLEAQARGGGELVPVDSEHSAILQCLQGAGGAAVRRLILTASGGAFRDWALEDLAKAEPEHALRHPTWSMGAKITVDSATMANKAMEVIEAHFLFGVAYDQVDVALHPQSIIHSMVEFADGSVLAQVGFPTMELPVLYALTHPDRLEDGVRRFDPVAASPLTFEALDLERYPAFALGVQAGRAGGTAPAAFNAANEEAVTAFLERRLSFPGIADAIRYALDTVEVRPADSLAAVKRADAEARAAARTMIEERS
ncbi:MAG TPA: 1-deoxy-D-xylulose-5-phosphate reductoisomerase [Longimicrobiales bacterium]|nr:1-deoxy-D-xylulose-5-phosphate reductoisomerase [Longimicrobiales bacterium]